MTEIKLALMEAIVRWRIVRSQYNGELMELAPHLLFERRGDLFVGALNIGKAWRSAEEMRLGYFKLNGLSSVELTEEIFEPLPTAPLVPPRDGDQLVLAVSEGELISN